MRRLFLAVLDFGDWLLSRLNGNRWVVCRRCGRHVWARFLSAHKGPCAAGRRDSVSH